MEITKDFLYTMFMFSATASVFTACILMMIVGFFRITGRVK